MRIIPAIDIIDGKCVRLTKGDYNSSKIYSENPLEMAKSFADAGIQYLHLVDLDGAKSRHIVNYKILNEITSKTNLKVDFGGGIQTDKDVSIAFENGAKQITVGSIAVSDKEKVLEWLLQFGSEKIILGADCRDHKIAVHGWKSQSEIDVFDFVQSYFHNGIQSVICTDIAKDGMLEGPAIALYQSVLQQTPINLIASGGISSLSDLLKLKAIGCGGAIIGKAIYEGKIKLRELSSLC